MTLKIKVRIISYTFATMASLCLVSGIVVLSGGDIQNEESRRIDAHA